MGNCEAPFPFPLRGKALVQFFKERAVKLIVLVEVLSAQNTVTNGDSLPLSLTKTMTNCIKYD